MAKRTWNYRFRFNISGREIQQSKSLRGINAAHEGLQKAR